MAASLTFKLLTLLLFTLCCHHLSLGGQSLEEERIAEYERRGYTWPPKLQDYTPSTKGWRRLNTRRFKQLSQLQDTPFERYHRYRLAVHSALLCQNFTEYGWGVTRAPQAVIDKLRKRLHDGLAQEEHDIVREDFISSIETVEESIFLHDHDMNQEILQELLPLHEAWAGVELVPNNAYGLRVYREGTNVNMHLDRSDLVISSILHIDHGPNDEPWPLVIEDFHGNTNEVYLESGDMLFYESSKCLHGRPVKMKGEYYSSLYSHYSPKDYDLETVDSDAHYRIPPESIWSEATAAAVVRKEERDDEIDELVSVDISVKEPGCEHSWCGLKHAVRWHGPAPGYGKVLSGGSMVTDLENIPSEESFEKNEDEL